MKYPIKSKPANPIITYNGDLISLSDLCQLLCSKVEDEQLEACEKLGITINEDQIIVQFREDGKAYESPEEDRTKLALKTSSECFTIPINYSNSKVSFPLNVGIEFDNVVDQPMINFLGQICIKDLHGKEFVVPLTGRGTAALEGKMNDSHASFCTGGSCASFQQKIAIMGSILSCLGINRDYIEIFRAHVLVICNKFHGREDIINYTIDKIFGITEKSYLDYMQNLYKNNEPVMLNHFLEFFEPHPEYFTILKTKLSSEELEEEMCQISSNTKGPDKLKISRKVRDIVNKFMMFNDLYFIKPYSGDKIDLSNEESISIYDICSDINSDKMENTLKVLQNIGVTVYDDKVKVQFNISGKKIVEVDKSYRYDVNEEMELFEMELSRENKEFKKHEIKMQLDIAPMEKVNFFGKIEIKRSVFNKITLPLVGRGTVDINGYLTQNFSNFCIDAKFASFQQKVAIMYTFFVYGLSVDSNSMRNFHNKIQAMNKSYFRREDVIEYLYRTVTLENSEGFFEFMRRSNLKYQTMPVVLKTIITYNRLPGRYYEDIISHFTEDELINEEKRFELAKYVGVVPRLTRKIGNFFQNINIF